MRSLPLGAQQQAQKEAAREHETDEDEVRWDEKLKKVVKTTPNRQND